METIIIPLAALTDRDLQYIMRIVDQIDTVVMKSNRETQTTSLTTYAIDSMQEIAHRLITCGIGFTYIPR